MAERFISLLDVYKPVLNHFFRTKNKLLFWPRTSCVVVVMLLAGRGLLHGNRKITSGGSYKCRNNTLLTFTSHQLSS